MSEAKTDSSQVSERPQPDRPAKNPLKNTILSGLAALGLVGGAAAVQNTPSAEAINLPPQTQESSVNLEQILESNVSRTQISGKDYDVKTPDFSSPVELSAGQLLVTKIGGDNSLSISNPEGSAVAKLSYNDNCFLWDGQILGKVQTVESQQDMAVAIRITPEGTILVITGVGTFAPYDELTGQQSPFSGRVSVTPSAPSHSAALLTPAV